MSDLSASLLAIPHHNAAPNHGDGSNPGRNDDARPARSASGATAREARAVAWALSERARRARS